MLLIYLEILTVVFDLVILIVVVLRLRHVYLQVDHHDVLNLDHHLFKHNYQ